MNIGRYAPTKRAICPYQPEAIMRIGVPTEIKCNEYRVGLVPGSVRELTARGHEVIVQSGAGNGIFADDETYVKAGARIVPTAEDVFAEAEMIVKVKEPQAVEYRRLQAASNPLHLSASCAGSGAGPRPDGVRRDGHRLRDRNGRAGRLAAARADERSRRPPGHRSRRHRTAPPDRRTRRADGRRPRRSPGQVVVLGGGVVGTHAARMAAGLGADVSIIDRSLPRLRRARRAVRGPRTHARLDHGVDRDGSSRRRRGDRRGAGRRRERAEARHPRHAPRT